MKKKINLLFILIQIILFLIIVIFFIILNNKNISKLFILIFLLLIFQIFGSYLFYKKISDYFYSIKLFSDNFTEIISNDDINNNLDVELIYIQNKIKDHLHNINLEKEKNRFVLNNMNQGIVVINEKKIILLINDFALKIFNYKYEDIINKNFLYLSRDSKVINSINESINERKNSSFEIIRDNKYLQIDIKSLDTEYFDFLKGVFILISDITDIKKTESIKKEFLANASHELKSPLTSIIGFQEMILNGVVSDENEIKSINKKILKKAYQMSYLVTDMLNLSYIEDHKMVYKKENINLKNIIEQVISDNILLIKNKNITLDMHLNDLYIDINHTHANMLFKNLIDNAIKYNKDKGKITILINDNEIIIEDSGIGIKKENINRVFERFFRENEARNDEGTGLGLAIVKHICLLYNIKISLFSEEGKYTRFVLKI